MQVKAVSQSFSGFVSAHEFGGNTKTLTITTEPNNLGEQIEIQVAEQRDLSLILVITGQVTSGKNSDGHDLLHIWPVKP